MHKLIALALFAAMSTTAAAAENNGVPMQSLLDKGFKIVASDGGGNELILQKDNSVYACLGTASTHFGDYSSIWISHSCLPIR